MTRRKGKHPKYYYDLILENHTNKPKKHMSYHEIMEKLHKSRLETIVKNPSLIGITSPFLYQIELPLYSNEEKVGELDILIANEEKNYFIEYKCHDCEINRNKAKHQLRKAQKYIDEKFKRENISLLYVHDKFVVEELFEDNWIHIYTSK